MDKFLDAIERIAPTLTNTIEQDEQNGRVSGSIITALRGAGLYNLFLPVSLGGFEADPLTVAKLTERVAHYNAAAAWSVMVMNISNWVCRFLPAEVVEEIYHPEETFCAGTFAAPVFAEKTKGGYLIKGQAPLCSNVHQAQWITLLSIVMQDGQPVMNNGMPELRAVFLKSGDCRILETWQALGMKATDSNDVVVENAFVPQNCSFILSPHSERNKHYKNALYRFPLTGIISCCLIVPAALAIATNAIEELKLLTGKMPSGSATMLKEKAGFQRKLGMAEAMVSSARAYLHQTLSDCWSKVQSGEEASTQDKANLLLSASHVNISCTNAVDLVYSASGTTGVYRRNNISRHFTDMQVVRQHGFANENRFETAAQLILGLQPDFFPAIL